MCYMKTNTSSDVEMFKILNTIEEKINLEKCWIEILKIYCNSNENYDISFNLILDTISKCNEDLFETIENNIQNILV